MSEEYEENDQGNVSPEATPATPAARPEPEDQRLTPTEQPAPPPEAYSGAPSIPPYPDWQAPVPPEPPPAVEPRIRTNVVLFLITLASTVYWGFLQYQSFYSDELGGFVTLNPLRAPEALVGGLPFGLAIIAFLLAHEMGHYLACRHYGIAASLPYFLPLPPPLSYVFILMPGTMGAVIRIRGVITSRRALFDIAVAGPIAGWLAALPIIAYGISQSRVEDLVEIETAGTYFTLGEPLLWTWMSQLFGPEISASQDLVMHPLAFVGWFALLITAFNLLPIGQLDGGHLVYALVPRWHRAGSFGILAFMLFAGIRYFPGWIVFAAFVSLLSLMSGGFRHPRPRQFEPSLGTTRLLLAVLALAIFVTSFMLVPVTLPLVF